MNITWVKSRKLYIVNSWVAEELKSYYFVYPLELLPYFQVEYLRKS